MEYSYHYLYLLAKYAEAEYSASFKTAVLNFLNLYSTEEVFKQWVRNNHRALADIAQHNNWTFYYNEAYIFDGANNIYLISKKPTNKLIDVIREDYLTPYQEIPALYLLFGGYIEQSITPEGLSKQSPELAHNHFIVRALDRFGVHDVNKIRDFLQQHRTKIDEIRHLMKGMPQYLGSGMDGVTFAINDNMVVKFFISQVAFEHAVQAMRRLHQYPELAGTEANIYDVDILGEIDGKTIYYYLMEKMEPIDKIKNRNVQERLENVVEQAKSLVGGMDPIIRSQLEQAFIDPANHAKIKSQIQPLAKEMTHWLRQYNVAALTSTQEALKLKDNWLLRLIEELIIKLISGRYDTNPHNLGITNQGELRFFDPAYG